MNSAEFPVLDEMIYLNHAAVAPWPKAVADAVIAFARENSLQGTRNYPQWLKLEQSLRDKAATLINARSADEIALVKNTSEGLSFVAYGLEWRAGDNVVGIAEEFPSNRFVWSSLADQGVEFRQLDLSHCRAQGINPEQALIELCDERTRLIAVSAVQYADGYRMDLQTLGAFCRQHDILFCVDAIQQIGAMPFDVEAIHADFAVADGHKWMLGPEGLGIFYVRHEIMDKLRLTQYGWHMAEELKDYSEQHFVAARTARRFECGSPNMLGIHALNAALELLVQQGMERVGEQNRDNIRILAEGLAAIPRIEILSDLSPQRRSGILTFRSKQADNNAMFAWLNNNKIFCAPRGGGIRFSPHFYIPQEQLDQVLETLERFKF